MVVDSTLCRIGKSYLLFSFLNSANICRMQAGLGTMLRAEDAGMGRHGVSPYRVHSLVRT